MSEEVKPFNPETESELDQVESGEVAEPVVEPTEVTEESSEEVL
jgi:hypothetical protein